MSRSRQEHTVDLTLESLLDDSADYPVVRRRPDLLQTLGGCCAVAVVAALSGASSVAEALVGGILALSGLGWLVSLSAAERLQFWQPMEGEADDS